ncbi:MAG: hypothetical protein FWG94_11800 [Oscillospiraceae bacterium]|nr:hypothetical protein [Oscillospiraceae bacterium]
MKTATCPKCFSHLTDETLALRCANNACPWAGISTLAAGAVEGTGGALACPVCGENFPLAYCPECGFPVREDELSALSLSVSLAGASGSGKSHYLAVLIQELKARFSKAFECALFPVGGEKTMSFYEKDYYTPLYSQGKCIPRTRQDEINPLLYSLVFSDASPIKAFDLTLYDAAGKNFESISAMSTLNRSLGRSGGIIFLVDPMELPKAAEKYGAHNAKPSRAGTILSRTIHLLRTSSGRRSLQNNLDIPFAVCLTKLDAIRDMLDPSSFVLSSSRQMRENAFEKYDFEACNLEMQSLFEALGGGDILKQVSSQFNSYAFFGLSSLGHEPSGGQVQHVAPHRVLDPLLWLFFKNKLIR